MRLLSGLCLRLLSRLSLCKSARLSLFNTQTARYEPRTAAPEAVWDGGDFQFAGGLYFATVGVQFNTNTGSGKGAKLYAYDPAGDSWSARADTMIGGNPVANEALAYDPVNHRLYATIVEVTAGALGSLRVDTERMRIAASDPLLLATDLAEVLVREGVPFREAHEAVGRIVAHCAGKEVDLRSLSREDLHAFHPAFPAAAAELASLEASLEARRLTGGTARANVEAALARAELEIESAQRGLDAEIGE